MFGELSIPGRRAREQRVELALAVEFGEVVRAADVALADEDLRHPVVAAAAGDHLGAVRRVVDVDLAPAYALALEQRAHARAISAPAGRVQRHERSGGGCVRVVRRAR